MHSPGGTTGDKRPSAPGRKVLILGSGFGGVYVLRQVIKSLRRHERPDITVVSDENFFLFSPLLQEVAAGAVEPRHIAYPIRKLASRRRFSFVQATVTGIDLAARRVETNTGTLDYDTLVLGLGVVTDMSGLKSPADNVLTLKTLRDARGIRNHIIGAFEQASIESDKLRRQALLTFVVSGGGYTGIQLVSDLSDLIHKYLTEYYSVIDPAEIRVMLVETREQIVGGLHAKFAAYIMKHLDRMGVDVRVDSRVTDVWHDRVEINGTEVVPTHTLLWVSGVVANPRIAELAAETDSIGRVVVDDFLALPEFPEVYAVGDCAHYKDPASGRPVAPRAHTAVRQAKAVARNVVADLRGAERKRYRYTDSGETVSLGESRAVLRLYGLRLYGFPARLLWYLAYASLVIGKQNRLRVMTDWVLSRMFGRDTTFIK